MGGSKTRTGGMLLASIVVLGCVSMLFAISGIISAGFRANVWLIVGFFLAAVALFICAILFLIGGVIIVLYSSGTDHFCYNLCTV
jgi:hypothetical protein